MRKAAILLIFILYSFSLLAQISNLSGKDEEKLKYQIGQMLIIGFKGMEISEDHHIVKDVKELNIGGVILFDYDVPTGKYYRNIESPQQLKKLTEALQHLTDSVLIIAIDQEGGAVNRLKSKYGFPRFVSPEYLGKVKQKDTTCFYAALIGKTLKEHGLNLNMAPSVDLNINPNCPVIGKIKRSFSKEVPIVVNHAYWWLSAQKKAGITGCIKHFPGHGSSTKDTHTGVTDITRTWREEELEPYCRLVDSGIVEVIMTSHVFHAELDSLYPATMSEKILTGILRNKIGFNGVIVTDDLAMGALVAYYSLEEILERSINAGADMLCLSNNGTSYDPDIASKAVEIILQHVRSGKIKKERIEESYRRIQVLKKQL